jgi:hypothetical protein
VSLRPLGNGLQPLVAVLVAESDNAQARAESLLWMRLRGENAIQQFGGKRADLPTPFHQARRRPLQVSLVRFRADAHRAWRLCWVPWPT